MVAYHAIIERPSTALAVAGLVLAVTAGCTNMESVVSDKNPPPSSAPPSSAAPPAPEPPAPPPTPVLPSSVPAGTWAKIPKPGDGAPDTWDNRRWYAKHVQLAVPGEPKINPARGRQLLQKVRADLAKQSSVPASAITVDVDSASGSITVAAGTKGGLLVRGQEREVGVCSEIFFATSLAGTFNDFAKAGVRALVCKSEGCQAVFDMRPTAPGGGIYAGDKCMGLADAMKAAGILVPE